MNETSPPPSAGLPAAPASVPLMADIRLYRAAVDGLPEAFIAFDAAGRIAVWNAQAEALFGWPATLMTGRCLQETILPGDAAPELLRAARIPAEPRGGRLRLAARHRNGEDFAVDAAVAAVDLDGQRYFTAFFRDIGDVLLTERQLVQSQKQEAIGHLTGGLAHDFNNILGIIIGSLDLVMPAVDAPMERELLTAALSAAHRGADITRALMAVARRRALKPQPTDVNELINELEPLLRQTAGKQVDVMFSPNALDAVCNIDAGGLNSALVNLVINARDAMPEGGQIVIYAYTTEVRPKSLTVPFDLKPGRYAVIGVDDTGCGMTPEVALQAFDPFFTTKPRDRGTGLGLAMVYGFARQSGGTARIESSPGRGASVQLLLPVMKGGRQEKAASSNEVAARGPARILLVDDEPILRRVGEAWLKSLGHRVSLAGNAEEALAVLAEHRFDLLVTDIVMPGTMDGVSLVERCRRLYPEMAALITTGFPHGQSVALRSHAPILVKPYTRSALVAAVNELLQPAPDKVLPAAGG